VEKLAFAAIFSRTALDPSLIILLPTAVVTAPFGHASFTAPSIILLLPIFHVYTVSVEQPGLAQSSTGTFNPLTGSCKIIA